MYILYTFTYVLHPSADCGEHVFVTRTFFRGCIRVRNSKNVLPDRAARNTYLTRYDIIFIHIHVIIMYTEGGGAFRKSIMFFFRLHFFSAHLGVNGFFNRHRCRRHHPKFHCLCAFSAIVQSMRRQR